MKRLKDFSKRTSALVLAAVLLLAAGTVTGVRAAFITQSDLFRAEFYVNHLGVHLLENGDDVCGGKNTIDGNSKITGALATKLGYSKDENGNETLGTVDPGKAYEEKIQAKNGRDIEQYVRLTVRKYWLKKDGGKATDLSPALIKLTSDSKDYDAGDSEWIKKQWQAYNSDAWVLGESSAESATYYYRTMLKDGETTEPLFDTLTIDRSVMPDMHIAPEDLTKPEYADYVTVTETQSGAKVYTYSYKYDGYTFYIEADVQALQTHNIEDAIHSSWGVYNIKVNSDGSLRVQQ